VKIQLACTVVIKFTHACVPKSDKVAKECSNVVHAVYMTPLLLLLYITIDMNHICPHPGHEFYCCVTLLTEKLSAGDIRTLTVHGTLCIQILFLKFKITY